jgi:DNA-directed RNA polymerase specialized sigma24 family protein
MAEPNQGSVTGWIESLRNGDSQAIQRLWERYIDDLIRLARARLRAAPRAVADEEDAVLCAFDSFCRGARRGRYPQLEDRHDLWRLLVVITERKAIDQSQHAQRHKRGGGKQPLTLGPGTADDDAGAADLVPAPQASPEQAAMLAEECEQLLGLLPNQTLREVALMKMEGYTHEEIAARLNSSPRSIARKVDLIRRNWLASARDEP